MKDRYFMKTKELIEYTQKHSVGWKILEVIIQADTKLSMIDKKLSFYKKEGLIGLIKVAEHDKEITKSAMKRLFDRYDRVMNPKEVNAFDLLETMGRFQL